jgi:hypothetical protein
MKTQQIILMYYPQSRLRRCSATYGPLTAASPCLNRYLTGNYKHKLKSLIRKLIIITITHAHMRRKVGCQRFYYIASGKIVFVIYYHVFSPAFLYASRLLHMA